MLFGYEGDRGETGRSFPKPGLSLNLMNASRFDNMKSPNNERINNRAGFLHHSG